MSARGAFRRRLGADERGAGAVEMALVLPLFVALMIGVFEFGWTQHSLSSIRYALEATSRVLLVKPDLTEAQLQDDVRARLQSVGDKNVTVTLNVVTNADGRVAYLTGAYHRDVGVPTLLTYPVTYNTTVATVLPNP